MPFPNPIGGGGGAPTDADYLVGTANPTLTAEIVAGVTPGGELGGTWPAPSVDGVHSGSAHHAEVHAIDGADHTGVLVDGQIPASIARDSELHAEVHAIGGADHTGSVTDAQHGARGPIVGAHGHDDLDTVGVNDHHNRDHSIIGAEQTGFPGGTTTFLRADKVFAAPTAAAADPVYSPGDFTIATETGRYIPSRMKLTTTQRATIQGTGRLVIT